MHSEHGVVCPPRCLSKSGQNPAHLLLLAIKVSSQAQKSISLLTCQWKDRHSPIQDEFFREAQRPAAPLELLGDEAALSAIAAQSEATNLGYTAE